MPGTEIGARARIGHALGVSLVLAATAGCAADDGDRARAAPAVVRDSAGVQIVESRAPAWREGEGLVVDAGPVLVIGGDDGSSEAQLHQVRAAFRMEDGRIAIFDGGSRELRYFDSGGGFLRKQGGKGGGPGEYQYVMWVARLPGDTLMVNDPAAQRLTLLAPDGSIARTVNLGAGAVAGSDGMPGRYMPVAPFGDGNVLAHHFTFGPPAPDGGTRDTLTYVRLGADGAVRDTVGVFPGDEMVVSTGGSGGSRLVMSSTPPFGRQSHVALDGDGFYFGSGDRYEIGRYAADGRLVRLIRRPVEPLPVTPADVEALKESELTQQMTISEPRFAPQLRRAMEEKWENAVLPATMPAHRELRVDRAGRLWVSVYARPADRAAPRFDVFDAEGRYLGVVAMPDAFIVREIGEDYVLGVVRDEFDVERVQMHVLRMARTGS